MIRIYSIQQALSLRGNIPELALIRSIQFQGEGYDPIEHGHIIVLEQGDTIEGIEELGCTGLHDEEGFPTFEYVEAFIENGHVVYEAVFQVDESKTVALIVPDEAWLDARLMSDLRQASLPLRPLPQFQGRTP